MDRGYINLISHLNATKSSLPLSTIQASIAHYLAILQDPTSLTASTLSSALFFREPLSHRKLQALLTAYRHAVHLKEKEVSELPHGLFDRGEQSLKREWTNRVMEGGRASLAILRLACYGGLLLGIADQEQQGKKWVVRVKVEDEVVVAVAEILDGYSGEEWQREFMPSTERGETNALSLALILASQTLPQVSDDKMNALPLVALSRALTATVIETFDDGKFLASLPLSPTITKLIEISPGSSLRQMSSSPLTTSAPGLTRLHARALTRMRPANAVPASARTLESLRSTTARVSYDWARSAFATVVDEAEIAEPSRETATAAWALLKTLLFSSVLLIESLLSELVFVRPPLPAPYTAASLSTISLDILRNLAFVITHLGGVTSPSVPTLQGAFFAALDVLASDRAASVAFLNAPLPKEVVGLERTHPLVQAHTAFSLACAEQLLTVIPGPVVRDCVLPLAMPHLWDADHRVTYELAHSVVLGVFAAHAGDRAADVATSSSDELHDRFAEKLIPFYTQCLIENSSEGKLSIAQLRLAFAALVRSAIGVSPSGDFAWFCIDVLLSSSIPNQPSVPLKLAMVSALPVLPLKLLRQAIDEIERWTRDAEVDRALGEVVGEVGEAERGWVVQWWQARCASPPVVVGAGTVYRGDGTRARL